MKKLLFPLLFLPIFASAQTKTKKDTIVKPIFRPDLTKPFTINVKISGSILNYYLYYVANSNNIDESTQLTAKQVSDIKKAYSLVADSIVSAFNREIYSQQRKFTADTLKKKK